MKWEPIETCPVKGEVLLFFPASGSARGHSGHTHSPMVRVGRPGHYPFRPPTHWCAIPAYPTKDPA